MAGSTGSSGLTAGGGSSSRAWTTTARPLGAGAPTRGAGTVLAAGHPASRCRNLASHVLGRAARAVRRRPARRRYGYRPWRWSTFVDETEQMGETSGGELSSRLGEDAGDGRPDRTQVDGGACARRYDVALEPERPIAPSAPTRVVAWRSATPPRRVVQPLDDGTTSRSSRGFGWPFSSGFGGWARRTAEARRTPSASPDRAITGVVCRLVRGHYRLIDQRRREPVTVENILAPHRERTLRRMRKHDTVLSSRTVPVVHPAAADVHSRGAGGESPAPWAGRSRPGPAHDAGGQSRPWRWAFTAGRVRPRRPSLPRPAQEKGAEAARGAEVVPDSVGATSEGAWGCAPLRGGNAYRAVGGDPTPVRARWSARRVHSTFIEFAAARAAGRTAGPGEGRPNVLQQGEGRRAHRLAPVCSTPGAQRAGPRRRQGPSCGGERRGEGSKQPAQGRPCGPRRRA